ncbi:MAG TPA: RNA 2',3'-cyclic phosphodiesterase [Candidatus Aminicenantes bacterium]|nr:RNA 2',3'-cyclic phosphodiesterase [Candidatus Aminicenantes bacterium]
MRVFIGIKPEGEFLNQLEAAVAPLRREFPGLNWVPSRNRHLTLRFLGEITDKVLNALCGRLDAFPPRVDPFSIQIDRLGGFSGRSGLRVVWAGIQSSFRLEKLKNWLEKQLGDMGIAAEDRPFHAHITLARISKPLTDPTLPQKLHQARLPDLTFPVATVHLFQSRLSANGPLYSILKEVPLEHA